MKAVRMHTRGGPEALVYEDAPVLHPALGEALVRVHAAAITPTEFTWDPTWTNSDGKDRRPIVPSYEVSGIVENVAAISSGASAEESLEIHNSDLIERVS